MDDLIFLGVFVAVMTLAFGYVRVCDRIVHAAAPSERTAP